jgi:hypothetical protein
VSSPGPDGTAALAAQVADLRSIVTNWNARLETLGLDGSLNLTAKLAELAGLVSEEIERTTAPYWLDYFDDQYLAELAKLDEWVTGVLVPIYAPAEIKGCWPNHQAAIWELSTLAAEWKRIYDRKWPLLAGALTWHDRWLPGTVRRLAPVMKDCTENHCTTGPLPAIETEN